MAKIELTFDDKNYTLEFTRRTVRDLENSGFNIYEASSKPVSSTETLFRGAFLAHHKNMKVEEADRIWAGIEDKAGLFEVLTDMYIAAVEATMEEPKESTKKALWEKKD